MIISVYVEKIFEKSTPIYDLKNPQNLGIEKMS